MLDDGYDQDFIVGMLSRVPVNLGGGKNQVPLLELVPNAVVHDLEDIVKDFADDL